MHSDLKPANFLLVKGALKLIDFGIAKAIMSDTTNIQRDSQVMFTCTVHISSNYFFIIWNQDVDCFHLWGSGDLLYLLLRNIGSSFTFVKSSGGNGLIN